MPLLSAKDMYSSVRLVLWSPGRWWHIVRLWLPIYQSVRNRIQADRVGGSYLRPVPMI